MDAEPKENSIKTNTWGKDGCSTKEKFNKKETNIWRDDMTFFLYSFQCAEYYSSSSIYLSPENS